MPTTPRPLWGWAEPARVLLAIMAMAGAIGLASSSKDDLWADAPLPDLVVDPNTAPPEVLNTLPGLGPTLVSRIVEARREAPFRSLDDLDRRVRGIGPITLAAIRPYLRIDPTDGRRPGPPTP